MTGRSTEKSPFLRGPTTAHPRYPSQSGRIEELWRAAYLFTTGDHRKDRSDATLQKSRIGFKDVDQSGGRVDFLGRALKS